ncbi:MAG: hypothetical protein ACEPOV_08315 [Hyphomicrobiales bacterium]
MNEYSTNLRKKCYPVSKFTGKVIQNTAVRDIVFSGNANASINGTSVNIRSNIAVTNTL